jgi:hypothetical protein
MNHNVMRDISDTQGIELLLAEWSAKRFQYTRERVYLCMLVYGIRLALRQAATRRRRA